MTRIFLEKTVHWWYYYFVKCEVILFSKKGGTVMILMDVKLNNTFGFTDFHMNFSYPKKIVNSIIDSEWLSGHPNFRYKKAVILMGANAAGKTTLGKALLNLFRFLNQQLDVAELSKMALAGQEASFSIDFINSGDILHRVNGYIMADDSNSHVKLRLGYSYTSIGKKDSYETCAERLSQKTQEIVNFDRLNKVRDTIGKIHYVFSCPDIKPSSEISNIDQDLALKVLRAVIGTLDPTLHDISSSRDLKNSFIIRRGTEEIIIQDGKLLNRDSLSSGTAEGIDISFFISLLFSGKNSFYYCDEHFSYIQSDIEKRIFGLMLEHLEENEQLIFTTHNPDMLDLNMPKHSFAFLRKRGEAPHTTSVIFASDILKRNTDSVHCALENDMFDSIPDDTLLNELEKGCL